MGLGSNPDCLATFDWSKLLNLSEPVFLICETGVNERMCLAHSYVLSSASSDVSSLSFCSSLPSIRSSHFLLTPSPHSLPACPPRSGLLKAVRTRAYSVCSIFIFNFVFTNISLYQQSPQTLLKWLFLGSLMLPKELHGLASRSLHALSEVYVCVFLWKAQLSPVWQRDA